MRHFFSFRGLGHAYPFQTVPPMAGTLGYDLGHGSAAPWLTTDASGLARIIRTIT